ncbi:MAG: murein biosynthesis integral membrane protein MurJ [Gammaproteobacteria bacterium]|nr:murein biosynthesis integral membrane protein MurJ [Gammaproteobacteria bacterium]
MGAVIQSKRQSLLRSTTLVSVLTFMSRLLGFVRDMVIAQGFGSGAATDAFFVAFRIPNFMRRLFAEGAFSQAFVPVLADYQQTRSDEDVRLFIARVAGQLGLVLCLITCLGMLFSPEVIRVFAPGFGVDSIRSSLASEMLRLTFPYLFFISLTAMAGAVLNTFGYFGVPAITPVFLNITMIAAVFFISPHMSVPVVGVAIGVLLAGLVQFLFQLPFLYKHHLLVRPRFVFKDEGVKRVLKLMVPALFGVSIAQLNLMVDSIFASFLKVGSVSWLYWTDRLTDFPLGVFGVAIATVILPYLSRRHVDQHPERFSQALDWGLRLVLLIGIPSALGLVFFSLPLIASCFAYGKFSSYAVLQTQKSLMTLGLGVPAFMMVKVLASGFYAKQDIKTPVKVGAWSMLVNSLLCAVFIFPLAHAGLTLASALAGYLNAGLLLGILLKRRAYQPRPGWMRYLLSLAFANICMGVYLVYMAGQVDDWLAMHALMRLGILSAHVVIAALIYILSLWVAGIRFSQFRGQMKGL